MSIFTSFIKYYLTPAFVKHLSQVRTVISPRRTSMDPADKKNGTGFPVPQNFIILLSASLCHDRLESLCQLVLLSLRLCQILAKRRVVDLDLRLSSGRTDDDCLIVLQLVDQHIG